MQSESHVRHALLSQTLLTQDRKFGLIGVERPEEGLVLPGAVSHVLIDSNGERKLVVLQNNPQGVGTVEFIELESAMTPYVTIAPDVWRWYALSIPPFVCICQN